MPVGSLGFMPKRRDKSPIKKTVVTDDGSPVSRIHARGRGDLEGDRALTRFENSQERVFTGRPGPRDRIVYRWVWSLKGQVGPGWPKRERS